jgi:hypothetical protein
MLLGGLAAMLTAGPGCSQIQERSCSMVLFAIRGRDGAWLRVKRDDLQSVLPCFADADTAREFMKQRLSPEWRANHEPIQLDLATFRREREREVAMGMELVLQLFEFPKNSN